MPSRHANRNYLAGERQDATDFAGMVQTLQASQHFRIFEFGDWYSTQHFMKQFFSGIFITIVMTGLDQDMMQKTFPARV